jgi:hypothetical protein
MKITRPHWLTSLVATVGAASAALAAADTFPRATGLLAALAGVCTLLAAPTLVSSSSAPAVKP